MRSLTVIALLLALAGNAQAGKREEAKRAFKAGEASFNIGRFDEALADFTRAYDLAPHPSVLFNIAQCHRNLRHYEQAIFFLERYLREASVVEDREAVDRLIAEMDRSLRAERAAARTRIVTTTVTSTVTLPVYVEVEEPIHTKAWFWSLLIGAVAVAGGAIAVGFALRGDGVPANDITIDLTR